MGSAGADCAVWLPDRQWLNCGFTSISAKKHYLEKSNDYSLNKKNKYKKTSIKNILKVPILEEDNFISTIKNYIKSENILFKNEGKIFNDDEIFHNRYKSFSEKSQINESNKDISQNTEKVEILEDGSICIKNTTGLLSPSLGEKFVEIKNRKYIPVIIILPIFLKILSKFRTNL